MGLGLKCMTTSSSGATVMPVTRLKDELGKIKLDPAFIDITSGGGKNSPAR